MKLNFRYNTGTILEFFQNNNNHNKLINEEKETKNEKLNAYIPIYITNTWNHCQIINYSFKLFQTKQIPWRWFSPGKGNRLYFESNCYLKRKSIKDEVSPSLTVPSSCVSMPSTPVSSIILFIFFPPEPIIKFIFSGLTYSNIEWLKKIIKKKKQNMCVRECVSMWI